MKKLAALAATLVALTSSAAADDDVLKPGDTISGRLRFFQSQHQNGTWIKVYQLKSDRPLQFDTKDEFCSGDRSQKTFHLMVDKTSEAQLKRRLNKTIAIVAEDFFCSETAWHVGDAVVGKWRFAPP